MMICWMLTPVPTIAMKRIVTMMVSLSLPYLTACDNAAHNATPRLSKKKTIMPFWLQRRGEP